MALYNTLFLFPFTVEHGAIDDVLKLPLATYHRWYWRVRRWKMTFSFGTFSASAYFVPSLDFDSVEPIADETGLLYPGCYLAQDGPLVVVGGTDYQDSAGGYFSFTLGSLYDPTTQTYTCTKPYVDLRAQTRDGRYDVKASVNFQFEGAQAVTVPLTIDGLSINQPGYFDNDNSPTAGVPSICCDITPVLFWGWGGKFDPTTGARL